MALKFEKVYESTNISHKNFFEVLMKIKKDLNPPTIRLIWGSEYAEFVISNSDKNLIFPQTGSDNFEKYVQIKEYTCDEFYELMKNAKLQIFEYKNNEFFEDYLDKYFSKIRINRYTDYSQTITDLEKEGFVCTITSNNIMTVDGRKFKFLPKIKETEPRLYNDNFYEVDCLGTSLFRQMNHDVEMAWMWHVFTKN